MPTSHAFDNYHMLLGIMVISDLFIQAGIFRPLSHAAVRKTFAKLLHRARVNSLQYAPHSFSIDIAATAAEAELPAWLIKQLVTMLTSTTSSSNHH